MKSSEKNLLLYKRFVHKLFRNALISLAIVSGALGIGITGYHYTEGFSWIDSLLNASMLLGGMGPITPMQSTGGKLFASFYALFCGLIFMALTGILAGPFLHQLLHTFHMEISEKDNESKSN